MVPGAESEEMAGSSRLACETGGFGGSPIGFEFSGPRADAPGQPQALTVEEQQPTRRVLEPERLGGWRGCRGADPIQRRHDGDIVRGAHRRGLKVTLGRGHIASAEGEEGEPLEGADVSGVALERGMPRGNRWCIFTLIGTNAGEQIVGLGQRGIAPQARERDGAGGFELATLPQALAEVEKGEPGSRAGVHRACISHGRRGAPPP